MPDESWGEIDQMIHMKALLDELDTSPRGDGTGIYKKLQDGSIDLAHACRSSIREAWDIELKQMDDRYGKKAREKDGGQQGQKNGGQQKNKE